MKLKNFRKELLDLFSEKDKELLFETLSKDKPNLRTIENSDFNNKIILLQLEIQKRYNDLMMYYKTEKNKIVIQHQQKMKSIDLQ